MGLFSNNKKPCPICGNATPRLLSTKVEGTPLCSECADKLDIRPDVMNSLTLNQLNEYMAFYQENAPLKAAFHEDYARYTGLLNAATYQCDFEHRTFRLKKQDCGIVYGPEHFVQIEIKQDDKLFLLLTKDAMHIYNTGVEDAILALKDEIEHHNNMNRMKETMVGADLAIRKEEAIRKAREEGRAFNEAAYMAEERERERALNNQMSSSFKPNVPFKKWYISLTINHPWGGGASDNDSQIWFKSDYPSVNEAMEYYHESVKEMKEFAMAFRRVCCPDCQVIDESAAKASAEPVMQQPVAAGGIGTADEIKKFKDLLDAGIITEEEFQAKKKQLLGL